MNIYQSTLPISEHTDNLHSYHVIPSRSKVTKKKIIVLTSIMMLCVIVGISVTLFLMGQGRIKKQQSLTNNVNTMILDQTYVILEKQGIYTIDQIDTHKIQKLIVKSIKNDKFNTTPFPNLKDISFQQNLKIQTLVINNSNIVEFSYNSTELLSIILLNNSKMTSFVNSHLPSLKNLTVSSSNISKWNNVVFGKLQNVFFNQSLILTLPNLGNTLKYIEIINCGPVSFDENQLHRCSNLTTFKLLSNRVIQNQLYLILYGSTLQRIQIQNYTIEQIQFDGDANYQSDLNHFSLVLPYANIIKIFNTNLQQSQLIINVKTIDSLVIKDDILTTIDIQTQTISQLYLQCPELKDINNIPLHNLTYLSLKETKLNLDSLSKYKFPKLQEFILINNTLLTELNNLHAPQLSTIEIINSSFNVISTTQYQKLEDLVILTCKIDTIITTANNGQQGIKIYYSSGKTQNAINLNFSSNKVNKIQVQYSNIIISDQDLSGLEQISIEDSTIVLNHNKINGNASFYFDSSTIIQFYNNTIGTQKERDGRYDFYNSDLGNFNQTFLNTRKIQFQQTNQTNISKFQDLMPNIIELVLHAELITQFSHFNFKNMTTLQLGKSSYDYSNDKLVSFEDNVLQSVNYVNLQGSSINSFRNNYMPNLKKLNIGHTSQLVKSQILSEFKSLKANGTQLLQLITLYNNDQQFKIQVKQIFPSVQIS